MTDSVTYDQNNMVGGGEVMEVMMTGGDGGEMNEDTLAQVVNMLQMEGQLTGGNHTIIIRQPGSNEIQMIQTTSNGGELIVSKASEADIQALQAGNGILENVSQDILESQQGKVVMMDEGGNLVEGVVQMQEDEGQATGEVMQLTQDGQLQAITDVQNANLIEVSKAGSVVEHNEILDGLVQMEAVNTQSLIETALHSPVPSPALSTKPITISTTTSKPKPKTSTGMNGEVVSIKINTGLSRKKESKTARIPPKNVIKISTVTGQQKYQPPKFHKCEACAINFVSKVAYMNHMENCPSKRKSLSTVNSKGNITYTCVFCETKFTSRLVLMQHVRTCDKAKSSKNLSANSKLKVTTSESKLKLVSSVSIPKSSKSLLSESGKRPRKLNSPTKFKEKGKIPGRKKTSILDPEDEPFVKEKDMDSDEDDEKEIVYDDEDDLNDDDLLLEDDNIEESIANKRSQKHLGPIIVKGMFKCRDCNRTFSKEYQYNRHVKACTNAPLNSSRIDNDVSESQANAISLSVGEPVPAVMGVKRKRGRPPAKDYANEEGVSPAKKRALGPKIVSVNPKRVSSVRGKPRFVNFSDNESDEEILDYLSVGSSRMKENAYERKNRKMGQKMPFKKSKSGLGLYSSTSPLSKIVKISPSDTLIKQTGKAMLSKMNKEKYSKYFKETPFCGLCGDKFKTNQELSLHTQICHSEDLLNVRDSLDGKGNLSSVKCPLCDLYFVSPHILLLHMVSFHDKDLRSVQEELESQNLNLVCPFCSDMCLTQDLLKEHMSTKHLDKLINKPSSTVSPMAIDVHAFIKEKNNGSILPTGKLLNKKEKVLCPECGLFFFKSYFEHHRCAAETYSLSARKFICSELQCSGLSFYKLIHLLTHLQQVHEKTLNCKTESFDSLTQFLEWLKREENHTKMKYTKALQRMKQGKLTTIWICHRFHNAMKDPTSVTGHNENKQKTDRLNQCYSRIHAETTYNTSTPGYDGKTSIKYYPEHRHPSETDSSKCDPMQVLSLLPSLPLQENQSPVLPSFATEESAFSDAAELKQLLEDDDDFDHPKSKVGDSSFEAQQLARFEALANEVEGEQEKRDENVMEELYKDEMRKDLNGGAESLGHSEEDGKIIGEESLSSHMSGEKLSGSKTSKDVDGLVSLSDADLLLEKMLGEHHGDAGVLPPPSHSRGDVGGLGNLAPTEAKITDVDMLEAFGGCITPEESSNPSTVSNQPISSVSPDQREEMEGIETETDTQPEEMLVPEPAQGLVPEQVSVPGLVPEHKPEEELQKEELMQQEFIPEETSNPMSEEASNPLSEEASNPLLEEASNPMSEEVSNQMSEEASNPMSEEASNQMSEEASNPMSEEASNPMSEEVSNPMSEEASNPMSEEASNPIPVEVSIPMSEEVSNPLSEEASTPIPEEASVSLPEEASVSLPEEASVSLPEEASISLPEEASISLPEEASISLPEAEVGQDEASPQDLIEEEVAATPADEEDVEDGALGGSGEARVVSVASVASELLQEVRMEGKGGEEEEEEDDDDEEKEGEEDNTYVLPADISEWNKLFELVSMQMDTNSIPEEEMEEAQSLLSYNDKIMSVQVEKQVEVFDRLCSLANVQMT